MLAADYLEIQGNTPRFFFSGSTFRMRSQDTVLQMFNAKITRTNYSQYSHYSHAPI